MDFGFDYYLKSHNLTNDFENWPADSEFEKVTISGKPATIGTVHDNFGEGRFPFTTRITVDAASSFFRLKGGQTATYKLSVWASCKTQKECLIARKMFDSIALKSETNDLSNFKTSK